jgi:hypothetical protein
MCTIPRLAAFCLVTLFAPLGTDAASPASDCMGLAALRIEDVNLHSTSIVPAAGDRPEHCRVLGVIRPAINFEVRLPTRGAWVTQANLRPDGSEILDRGKVGMIGEAVLDACDARDGRSDGLIDDPRGCESAATCLTAEEVGVLEKWYAGPRDASGRQLYPGGIPRGSEPHWPLWLTGQPSARIPGLVPLFAQDPPRLAHMGAIYNSDNPDLSAYAARGGKLIVYHGWVRSYRDSLADAAIRRGRAA